MKIYTSLTARNMPFKGEVNDEPSLTIPDQAISAPELLRRFATGQPLGFKNVEPVYDDQGDVPEFYKMSKLDRLHMLQNNSEIVNDLKEDLKAYQRSVQAKSAELERQKEMDKTQSETKSVESAATPSE